MDLLVAVVSGLFLLIACADNEAVGCVDPVFEAGEGCTSPSEWVKIGIRS